MSVRNYGEVGANAQNIVKRLMANQTLMRLLYYTDKDPLIKDDVHPDLTDEIIEEEIFGNYVRIIPRIASTETSNPIVVLKFESFTPNLQNDEFKDVDLKIEVFTPLSSWIIKNENLRPFLIMGEIQKSLDGKTVNGLGKLYSAGAALNFLTDEISDYEMSFLITSYD